MARPLEGIRVADFSHVMAGPYASHLLCFLGAEVIKVEAPGTGDAMRNYGPDRRYDGMSPSFIAVNAGKKSIALDLKNPQHLDAAKRLIAKSDVVLENFRPGVMNRLGLGYEQARELKKDIIYCSVSGYGQDTPLRDWPAIDNIVQATAGIMSLSGSPDDPPIRVGFPMVDTLTGQTAALSVMAALMRRERSGGGEYIDVSMLEASLAFTVSAVVPYLVTGKTLARTGNTGYSGQPTTAVFECSDGRQISLGVVQQNQFVSLAKCLEREDWLKDPRYTSIDRRKKHSEALIAELQAALRQRTALEWEAEMSARSIPCGMIRSVDEAADFEFLERRGAKVPLHVPGLPDDQDISVINAGFCMSEDGPGVSSPPPRLGEHGREVLAMLGYSDQDVEELLKA